MVLQAHTITRGVVLLCRKHAAGARPVVGVLGCMAERLKEQLLDRDKLVDIVAGPDAYRDVPRLIAAVQVVPVVTREGGLAAPAATGPFLFSAASGDMLRLKAAVHSACMTAGCLAAAVAVAVARPYVAVLLRPSAWDLASVPCSLLCS